MSPAKCITVYALLILLGSCREEQSAGELSQEDARSLLDSLRCNRVLAAFNENEGCSWILESDSGNHLLKVTWRAHYPLFIDSLTKKRNNLFSGQNHNFEYEIGDKEVTVTFIRKVVHPSSNWQGQTPGYEYLSTIYPRTEESKK